ncbi:amidase domain-containing protein [Streptomyces orinoci]|uniref:Amidase domain-containing protein n=1 Tax=Streptomyces orinoci TaxID=67339 RepID=A0ABV3K831_STRON|nr:amidase domain-containing protein [Streptomyces orinoci]
MRRTTVKSAVGVVLSIATAAVVVPATAANAAARPAGVDQATAASFARATDVLLAKRTAALLDGTAAKRVVPSGDRTVHLSAGVTRSEKSALATLQARKKRLAALGEAYTSGDTRVAVDQVRVKGKKATVRVTESTTLAYKKIHGDEPSGTGFKARHEVSFTATGHGKWELTGIKSADNGAVAVNAPAPPKAPAREGIGPTPAAKPSDTSWGAPSIPKRRTGLNYSAMAAYAEKYWRNYNPAYRQFNEEGGDCTNFISQALKAGGWKPETGPAADYRKWWYSSSSQSHSWVGANEWSWYAQNSKRVTHLPNVFQLEVGDILQMDFDGDGSKDHSMITTYKSRWGVPYLTYHSTNTYRKSLLSILASYPDADYYAYRT